jgi:hypothetical protein
VLKIGRSTADVDAMTDASPFLLDGDLPRLGEAGPVATPVGATEPTVAPPDITVDSSTLPTLPSAPAAVLQAPVTPPVLTDPAPVVTPPPADAPTLPTPASATPTDLDDDTTTQATSPEPAAGAHPMAHLMPAKAVPTEASLRAAELRATKKAKAKKVKIAVAVGSLVVAGVVGPPLGKWLVDAINQAGSVSTDGTE